MNRQNWQRVMFYGTIAKAGVVGTTIGLAAFGAMDFAFAVAASDWLEAAREDYLFDAFAVGGGIAGAIVQAVVRA